MSARSASGSQKATIGMTCSRRNPWRRTNEFCAPMAAISVALKAKPAVKAEVVMRHFGSASA